MLGREVNGCETADGMKNVKEGGMVLMLRGHKDG